MDNRLRICMAGENWVTVRKSLKTKTSQTWQFVAIVSDSVDISDCIDGNGDSAATDFAPFPQPCGNCRRGFFHI
jgi:hypothetical protein